MNSFSQDPVQNPCSGGVGRAIFDRGIKDEVGRHPGNEKRGPDARPNFGSVQLHPLDRKSNENSCQLHRLEKKRNYCESSAGGGLSKTEERAAVWEVETLADLLAFPSASHRWVSFLSLISPSAGMRRLFFF